jgi:hypothetical protein
MRVLGSMILLFPVWPVIATGCAILFYSGHARRAGADRRIPIVLYVVAVLVSGALAALAGMLTGIYWACSRPENGNLCGLIGVFVTGPIAGSAAIVAVGFALSRMRADREPTG